MIPRTNSGLILIALITTIHQIQRKSRCLDIWSWLVNWYKFLRFYFTIFFKHSRQSLNVFKHLKVHQKILSFTSYILSFQYFERLSNSIFHDKWIRMMNFEFGMICERWIDQHVTSIFFVPCSARVMLINSPFTFHYWAQNSPSLFTYHYSWWLRQCWS